MGRWVKIDYNESGTYSITTKLGERATGSLKDLIPSVISLSELRELSDKARQKGEITEECYWKIVNGLLLEGLERI